MRFVNNSNSKYPPLKILQLDLSLAQSLLERVQAEIAPLSEESEGYALACRQLAYAEGEVARITGALAAAMAAESN